MLSLLEYIIRIEPNQWAEIRTCEEDMCLNYNHPQGNPNNWIHPQIDAYPTDHTFQSDCTEALHDVFDEWSYIVTSTAIPDTQHCTYYGRSIIAQVYLPDHQTPPSILGTPGEEILQIKFPGAWKDDTTIGEINHFIMHELALYERNRKHKKWLELEHDSHKGMITVEQWEQQREEFHRRRSNNPRPLSPNLWDGLDTSTQ